MIHCYFLPPYDLPLWICSEVFIGAIPDIWAANPAELRLRGADQGWSTALKLK